MIDDYKFGSFVINGKEFLGDIKILGNRVKQWDDRVKHKASFSDMKELLESNPEVIVVGTGNSGYLELDREVKDLILAKRIILYVSQNKEAVRQFNRAYGQNKKVAAIFHSTC